MTQLPAILTTEEAAAAIRVHPETLRRWVREGKVSAIELPSGTLRFKAAAIEQMLSGEAPVADAGAISARVAVVLAGTVLFGTVLGVATARPLLVLSLLASVLVVGALCVLAAAAAAVVPEVLGALVDEARVRHRAGMARLRGDAMRRHPAGTAR